MSLDLLSLRVRPNH